METAGNVHKPLSINDLADRALDGPQHPLISGPAGAILGALKGNVISTLIPRVYDGGSDNQKKHIPPRKPFGTNRLRARL